MSKKRREKTKAKQMRHKQENQTEKTGKPVPNQAAHSNEQTTNRLTNTSSKASAKAPSKVPPNVISKAPSTVISKAPVQINPSLKLAAPEWKDLYSKLSDSMINR